VAIDSKGNLFVTDNSGLSEVTALAVQSVLQSSAYIRGVAVDASDNIYYADNNNNRVESIQAGTTNLSNENFVNFSQNLLWTPPGVCTWLRPLRGRSARMTAAETPPPLEIRKLRMESGETATKTFSLPMEAAK
jgi:hypothetical protein